MTRINRIVLCIFLGGLSAVVVAFAAWDVWIFLSLPKGSTISWSMALLGQSSPFLVFVVGHVTGGLLWGLAAHFWAGMMPPEEWDELVRLRAEKNNR